MRIYPDVLSRRFAWLGIDLLVVLWIAAWVRVGQAVDGLVLHLDVLAQGLIGAGRTFDGWIASFEQAVPANVPVLSDSLRHAAELLRQHSGQPLISLGQAGSTAIHRLALLLALIVAAVPVALALVLYVPRRIRLIASMRGVHLTLKRALARPELSLPMMEILAGRAIYTLPYAQLLRYSRNPAEDWQSRNFPRLARAELERYGLSLQRYFGRDLA